VTKGIDPSVLEATALGLSRMKENVSGSSLAEADARACQMKPIYSYSALCNHIRGIGPWTSAHVRGREHSSRSMFGPIDAVI
jgi:hypothetical protein